MKKSIAFIAGVMLLGVATTASAVLVTFTGGTRHHTDGTTSVTGTGNDAALDDTDYYVEGGFKLDFINSVAGDGEHLGDYYGQDASGNWNDVIHGHWAPQHGSLDSIDITKVGGGTFDINAFTLTSNSIVGGGAATGNEKAWIQAWSGGSLITSILLAPDSWGWDGVHNPGALQNDPLVTLGSAFDAVDLVRFTVTDPSTGQVNAANVFCFGMDDFFINEPAPTPEPGILALLATGLVGIFGIRRRFKA